MFEEYPKQVILKDGQEVVFRLLRTTDFQALMDFFGRVIATQYIGLKLRLTTIFL